MIGTRFWLSLREWWVTPCRTRCREHGPNQLRVSPADLEFEQCLCYISRHWCTEGQPPSLRRPR
jgi:hypothetical protein